MVLKECKCTLEERISKKTGNPYKCVVVKLTDSYEKVAFLTTPEAELLKMQK